MHAYSRQANGYLISHKSLSPENAFCRDPQVSCGPQHSNQLKSLRQKVRMHLPGNSGGKRERKGRKFRSGKWKEELVFDAETLATGQVVIRRSRSIDATGASHWRRVKQNVLQRQPALGV